MTISAPALGHPGGGAMPVLPICRWVVAATAAMALLVPRVAAPHPPSGSSRSRYPVWTAFVDPGAAVRRASPALPPGCPVTVDDTDPLAVAGAAARWLYCAAGPSGILSPHARLVVARLVAADRAPASAALTTLVLLDPRSAPVVVYAAVTPSTETISHPMLLTLFPKPGGGWLVDDVAVLGH